MRISDWSSYVCSSDLAAAAARGTARTDPRRCTLGHAAPHRLRHLRRRPCRAAGAGGEAAGIVRPGRHAAHRRRPRAADRAPAFAGRPPKSEEHTSELQSLMRISYAVFCLKKKKTHTSKYL